MKIEIKATRKQLIAAMGEHNISRRINKMDLHDRYRRILVSDAVKASKTDNRYQPRTLIDCRVYVTHGAGMYGHQFLAAIWIRDHVTGSYYQASGSMTSGCGYDKVSTAIDSACRALGLNSDLLPYFDGTGQHEEALDALAQKLAGRRAWFRV